MLKLNEGKFRQFTRKRHHKESLIFCAVRKIISFSPAILETSKKFLVNLAVISLICEQFIFISASTARAAELPITPDGSTNTQIDRAANNVPIVNIAAPNSGGLSHNKFENYNVNPSGLILNNAIGSQNGVIQTQIGGLINDNANLKNSGAASVILNEITSNNISQINGYTEIAGKKADLVLANPNGFVFNGSGFINVSKFTAVVGSSNQFNPNPNDLTFRLSDNAYAVTHGFLPKLTIMSAGIDLENITSTDLVANVMNIVAPVYAGTNDVNLRTGDQTFNYLTKAVTSDNANPGSNLPDEVAIDASTLGKIQAGRIFIVATKEGFGIKYSGDLLASRAGITIDNQGNINYNNAASEVGNIEVTSHKGSVTQNGISQTKDSGSDIKLTAFGNIVNSGQFISARNINLETSATFRNESSATNFSNNDFTIKAVDLLNLGNLTANRDLNIEATASITNSKELVSGRTLALTAPQINNSDSIYSNGKIAITATNSLTNNKDIVALGTGTDDGVSIVAKTLNNNQRIAASKNVVISSDSLNSNTANSTILALNNVNLNFTSLDNSNGNIQAASTLSLRNLVLNDPTAASLFSVTSQSSSITNSSSDYSTNKGSLFAGSLIDIDLGSSSDYIISGTLTSTGNIKIKSGNITNQTAVKANGYIKAEAADQFVNGSLNGNNSNVKFVSGTYLDITTGNLLSNYGTLSSNTDLTLTSTAGNINNNANAEIIGGTGKLTLSAKNGTVYQNSLHSIVANGDYSLDVTDFVNTGRVDVAGNLTLNVANNLTNEAAAMIYAGGNMELNVVNNLTNKTGAVIYSEGNMTIQKYALTSPSYNAANNKSNLVSNLSGQIISYGGNMRIDANTITNERVIQPFNALIDPYNNGTVGVYYTTALPQYWDNYSWTYGGGYCFGHNCQENVYYYYAPQLTNSGSIASWIQSGGTLTFNAGTVSNNASNISSVGNLTINADTLNNHSVNDPGLFAWRGVFSGSDDRTEITPAYNTSYGQNNPSSIKSGGNITLNVTNNISNAATTNGTETIATKTAQLVNAVSVDDLTKTGSVSLNLSNYFSGPSENGLFQKSTNPNGPLFETRSQFIDQSKFFGSNYFYTRIGLNLTDVQTEFEQTSKRLVGDQFFQNKIISEQLTTITKNSFLLSSSENNVNNEIKSLLDNAADEYSRLGLVANKPLTQVQINGLQKDIVWFETEVIDGATYIVPKIYLSQATRTNLANGNLATKSSIYAAGDVTMTSTAGKISNNGSIIAGNNITLSANGNILNKNFSEISAGNALSLTSTAGSISNFSQLKANGALSLSAAKDIINSSTVNTNDKDLLASGNVGYVNIGAGAINEAVHKISSSVLETAGISGGSITINAGNDFTNHAAKITATKNALADNSTTSGNVSIAAGDDVTIDTLQLRNRTEESWGHASKGGSKTTDTTTNVGSEIASAGSLTLTTTGLGTNNEKATVDQKYQTAQSQYNTDLTTYNQAVADYPVKLAAYNDALAAYNDAKNSGRKGHLTEPTPPVAPVAPTAPVYSQIMASVDNGGSDIKISGSKISTTTNGSNININANDSVNITSAVDSSYKMETSNKKGTMVEKSSVSVNSSTTNVASNITSLGDVTINSGLDTNIIASNLSGSGSGSIISGGDTNIFNGVDTSYSYSQSTTTRTGLIRQLPGYSQLIQAISTVYSPYLSLANGLTGGNLGKIQQVSGTDYNKSNLTNGSTTEKLVSSNLTFGNNLTVGSNVDLTIKASNLKTTSGDITLAAVGDVNILSAAAKSTTDRSYRDKSDRAKERGSTETTEISNISSTVNSGSDLTIISGNDTTIQSSKLSSGDNLSVDAGNNLLLLTANDTSVKSDENKSRTTYAFSNGSSGFVDSKAVNNEITSNTNSATVNSNLNLNATNSIVAQYRAGTMENVLSGANSSNQQLAYLKTLNDLSKTDPTKITFDPVADTMKQWDQTGRGLTQAGTAVVAIAAVAVTVVTMGSGATLGAAMLTAAAASGAATASVSAVNASMNTDSSLLGSTKTITKTAVKDTTSKESIQNMAIAAATAGAVYGAGVYIQSTSTAAGAGSGAGSAAGSGSGAASSTGAAANTTTTVYVSPNLTSATAVTSNTASSSSFFTNLGNATIKVGTATTANIAATSAIKGQSIGEVVASQGGVDQVILSSALQIIGEAGAMQIGNAAHGTPIKNADGSFVRNIDGSIAYTTPTITQGQQLALHAALGCGVGAGMSGGASGCASGAAAGVIGELTAGAMYQEGRTNPDGTPIGFSRNTSIAIGGLSGSMASLFTSALLGDEDGKMAKNIYAGNFVGTNAAANNSTLVDKNGKVLEVDKEDGDRGIYIDNEDGGARKDIRIGNSKYIDTFINPDTGEVDRNSVIKFGVSMDKFVENVSNIGGATAGGADYLGDLYYLAKDSSTGAPFDVKTKLGAFNGYLLNGEYVTGRDVGNYLAGVNGTKAGMPEFATLGAAGALQTYRSVIAGDFGSVIANGFGEAPYSRRMILDGIINTQNPVRNNVPLVSIPTSNYYNNATSLLFNNQTNH